MSAPASGTSTPNPGLPGNAALKQQQQPVKDQKPTLAGVKTKQRKGVAKAQAKQEPTVFRDELIKQLSTVSSPTDWESYLRILENAANDLDIRRYDQQLFELLIIGRLIAPGGGQLTDGADVSPFCVLGRDVYQQKEVVGVLGKLIRRYKYLQKPLDEVVLPSIIQNANRLDRPLQAGLTVPGSAVGLDNGHTPSISGSATPTGTGATLATATAHIPRPNVEKLAYFIAHATSSGLVSPAVIGNAKRDHLIKDGTSLILLTSFCKTYLAPAAAGGAGETLEQLSITLRKGGCSDLLEFFPLQRRSLTELQRDFKERGLERLAAWYGKVADNIRRDEVLERCKDILNSHDDETAAAIEELSAFVDSVQKSTTPVNDQDVVVLLWQAIMSRDLEINSPNKDQVAERVMKWLKATDMVLEKFTVGAKSEIALINAIQVHFYDNPPLITLFPRVLQMLYNDDVLSSSGIFYWYEKGAKPNGKQTFLKATEPLVKAIRQSEDEDDDDD